MKNCREQHRGQGHAMSAGLDACFAHSASAHRDRLACTRRIQPPDSTTTYAAAGRGRLRWPAARSTPARCSLAQLSGSHCERGRWSTLTRRRSSRLWLTQAGVRFFSRRGCSIPPRAICSLDAPPAARSLAPAPCRGRPHWPLPIRAATLLTFGEVRRVGRAIRTPHGYQVRAMARSLLLWLLYYH